MKIVVDFESEIIILTNFSKLMRDANERWSQFRCLLHFFIIICNFHFQITLILVSTCVKYPKKTYVK